MTILKCKSCNEERTEEYFYSNYSKEIRTFRTNKCKICCGAKKPRLKFDYEPTRTRGIFDVKRLHKVLDRLEKHKGMAKDDDIADLIKSYGEIYGDSIPDFNDVLDRHIFMWEKLKIFKNEQWSNANN